MQTSTPQFLKIISGMKSHNCHWLHAKEYTAHLQGVKIQSGKTRASKDSQYWTLDRILLECCFPPSAERFRPSTDYNLIVRGQTLCAYEKLNGSCSRRSGFQPKANLKQLSAGCQDCDFLPHRHVHVSLSYTCKPYCALSGYLEVGRLGLWQIVL